MGVTIYPECVENAARSGIVLRPISDTRASLPTEMIWQAGADPITDRFARVTEEYVRRWPDGRYRGRAVTPLGPAREAQGKARKRVKP